MKKTPRINDIFELDNTHYTREALLLQDILDYYHKVIISKGKDNSFRFWDLAEWLVENNLEFYSDYKGSHLRVSKKIENRKERIKNALKFLEDLGLIGIKGTDKARKVNAEVDIYEYTKSGILFTLIIQSVNLQKYIATISSNNKIQHNKDRLEKVNDEIYRELDSTLTANLNPPYSNVFFSRFFWKSKNDRIFHNLIQHIYHILSSDTNIRSVNELLFKLVDLGFPDPGTRRRFFSLWKETIEELDPDTRAIFLYQMKLSAERRFEERREYLTRAYEQIRFEHRNEYENIVVEGTCANCGMNGIIVLNYLKYREGFAKVHRNEPVRVECINCNKQDNMIISHF